MPTIDWDKWSRGWALGFPKNQMWGKIRTGETDERGEPTYQYDEKPNVESTDPALADVLAEHRFVQPALAVDAVTEHCFCGWNGSDHADHLADKVNDFANPVSEPVGAPRRPKKAVAPKVEKDSTE